MKVTKDARLNHLGATEQTPSLPEISVALIFITLIIPVIAAIMEFFAVIAFLKTLPFMLLHSLFLAD